MSLCNTKTEQLMK